MGLRTEHAAVMAGYFQAIVDRDFTTAARLLDDDFVEVYPQSGPWWAIRT